MLYQSSRSNHRRQGLVLLVVMAMLALFASTALAFVFYADNEGVASKMHRESLISDIPDVDAEALAGFVLNQLLYPTENPYSALRGWDLARSIYGYNPVTLNYTPYNGVGREAFAPRLVNDPDLGVPYFNMINTQTYWDQNAKATDKTLNFVRTPEYFDKVFFGPLAAPPTPTQSAAGPATYRYVGGANAPRTAYDTDNLFLAQVDANGKVFMPSGRRPWLEQYLISLPLAQQAAVRRYLSLRPESGLYPNSWNPRFITPDSEYKVDTNGLPYDFYDVRNLDFGPGNVNGGNNDSFWIDAGFPVMTAPNSKRYKILVAPLIMDLSNRLHLFAHNNRLGVNGAHVSNEGLGPTEVNASKVLGNTTERQALMNLIYGGLNGTAASVPVGAVPNLRPGSFFSRVDADALDPATGRSSKPFYGGFTTPRTQNAIAVPGPVPPGGVLRSVTVSPVTGVEGGLPWYFFDAVQPGVRVTVGTEIVQVVTVTPATSSFTARFTQTHPVFSPVMFGLYSAYPNYPASWGNTAGAELTNNPLALNLLNPNAPNIAPLPLSNQEALLRFGGTNGPALTSELFKRMPAAFAAIRARNMVTLSNWHFDRVTGSPFLNFDRTATPAYTLAPGGAFPTLNAGLNPPVNYAVPASANVSGPPAWNSEYNTEWRQTLGNYLRVDLTRPLTDYPATVNVAGDPVIRIATPLQRAQYTHAVNDRVNLANDIYKALIRVTGARDPNVVAVAPGSADYDAARWLAQLSVNIVDYIDNDDYITPFNWNKTPGLVAPEGWVFGTELPRLVLNEAYAQHDFSPQPHISVWAELHNPFFTTPAGAAYPRDGGIARLFNAGTASPVYRLEWYKSTPAQTLQMRQAANSVGAGNLPDMLGGQANWGNIVATRRITPSNGAFSNATIVDKAIAPDNVNPALAGARAVGTTVTIRTTTPHGFVIGQAVTITGVTNNPPMGKSTPQPGYEGTFVITATTANTFTFISALPPGVPAGDGIARSVTTNANTGFYVIGPDKAQYTSDTRNPKLPATYASTNMSAANNPVAIKPVGVPGASQVGNTVTIDTFAAHGFTVGQWVTITNTPRYNGTWQVTAAPTPTTFTFTAPILGGPSGGGEVTFGRVSFLLKRLANPHLPFNNVPGNALYNPYITVDYLDDIPITADTDSVPGSPSYGRRQPYAANKTANQVVAQVAGISAAGEPRNTFFSHNGLPGSGTLTTPFDWLVHLDRAPVNPIELAHVSCFKPHELTQQFITGAGKFQHNKAWQTPATMLYRLLDQSSTHYMAGLTTGGRFPGNININTMTEPEIFQALCDAHDNVGPPAGQYRNPWFTQADVTAVYNRILLNRHNGGPAFPPTSDGKPFVSFSAGNFADTLGRNDIASGAPVFSAPSAVAGGYHPYAQGALLQKVYNNISTTSNVFAVWFTVGYFEVVDESVRPARLGAEIGRAENRHIRHRFFSIVDRSGMKLLNTTAAKAVLIDPNQALPQTQTIGFAALSGSAGGVPLAIQPGMLLEIGTGANAEVVLVKSVGPGNTFTADFMKAHPIGAPIVCRGNPGPWAQYNPHRDTDVVLHLSVIQ